MRPALIGVIAFLAGVVGTAQTQSPPAHSIRDGVYSDEQAQRGAEVYVSYCASCHGADLLGGFLLPRSVPALRGGVFIADWKQMRLGDLFYRIRVSMPQGAPGSLSRSKNADILAFLLRENGYPSSSVGELRQNDDAWLNDILIEP